jgi:hypothetical protein
MSSIRGLNVAVVQRTSVKTEARRPPVGCRKLREHAERSQKTRRFALP